MRDRKKNLKGKCNKCSLINSCGGCRAHAYAENKDFFSEDPLCWKVLDNYDFLAKYYDYLMRQMDYPKKSEKIKKLLNKYKVNSVIDLGCGTGGFTISLKNLGFDCVGIDISKEMIKVAKSKDRSITWINEDMTKAKTNKTFEAAICLFDTVNHLLSMKEVDKFFKNVASLLNEGGIFLFDINTDQKKKIIKKVPSIFLLENGKEIIQLNRVDKNFLISEFSLKGEPLNIEIKERLYSVKEIKNLLEKNNFKIINIYDGWDFEKKASNKSLRAMFFARKLSS
ncbi:MAG: methyltransferase domain-containing protein [Candidatus Micrarchaeia archaeon]